LRAVLIRVTGFLIQRLRYGPEPLRIFDVASARLAAAVAAPGASSRNVAAAAKIVFSLVLFSRKAIFIGREIYYIFYSLCIFSHIYF
jgi:hypothetical protein